MKDMPLHRPNSIKKQLETVLCRSPTTIRGSAGETIGLLQILEGKMNSQTAKGRPRRMWVDDIKNWMSLDSYSEIKNIAQNRHKWRACVQTACQPSASEDDDN